MIGCNSLEPLQMSIDQLQTLVWDMDGTLIDSGAVVPDAFIATDLVEYHGTATRNGLHHPALP
jgi:phosphoglycolate phosphatase-like HAD superfamily hydrolase